MEPIRDVWVTSRREQADASSMAAEQAVSLHSGDGVFVGSDTQLVAPVSVGKGSTIAAGTTVTRDIAENELVLSRVKQVHIQGWQRPVKKKS